MMMIATPILLALSPIPADTPPSVQVPDLLAIRARRVEVGNGQTLENAVILVEDGKLVTVGEDLPLERGIPVLELDDEQVVMPGLVNAYSRVGMSGDGYNDSRPWILASKELYPPSTSYEEVLAAGVTTLGQYPAGNGIPGRAVAVRPHGTTTEEMILSDEVYLKVIAGSSRSAKNNIRDGFKKADDWLEKERKNREKWEKAKAKFDKEKDKEKKAKLDPGPYKPLDPDPKAQSFLDLREKKLKALISIRTAGDYLHLLDAIGEEQFDWDLRVVMTRELDVFHIEDRIGERNLRVIMEPELTLHPGTMRQRNLPAEFARAGARLVFVPRSDSITNQKAWLRHVGEIVGAGLDPQTAIRAMTLEPAELLGLGEQLGSLEPGKAANLVILSGDPFEPATKIDAVMLDGRIVSGEVDL